jgi:hypothetical protein
MRFEGNRNTGISRATNLKKTKRFRDYQEEVVSSFNLEEMRKKKALDKREENNKKRAEIDAEVKASIEARKKNAL